MFTVVAYCMCLLQLFTASVYCCCLLRVFTAVVYCKCLLLVFVVVYCVFVVVFTVGGASCPLGWILEAVNTHGSS